MGVPPSGNRSRSLPAIYLDHAATTPVLPAARVAYARGLDLWANPSSPHAPGRAARAALEAARAGIAEALGWPYHVVLTGGASEAIALAIGGGRWSAVDPSPLEHEAVLRAARGLVPGDGLRLAAVQTVNGETGIVSGPPVGGDVWLADASQSAGRLPLPEADLIVVSGHKVGAPPGIGALLVRDLSLLRPGGGQEQGYRAGTENLPGALALAAALAAPRDWLEAAAGWRGWLEAEIIGAGGAVIAGDRPRLATVGAYRMPGVSAAAQLIRFDMAGIAVSAGSACSSGSLRPSPVLAALGLDEAAAGEVIRVGFGWPTTFAEVTAFRDAWMRIAHGRRAA